MDGEQALSLFPSDISTPWAVTQSKCEMNIIVPSVIDWSVSPKFSLKFSPTGLQMLHLKVELLWLWLVREGTPKPHVENPMKRRRQRLGRRPPFCAPLSFSYIFKILNYIIYLSVCWLVGLGGMCATTHVWKSVDNLQKIISSLLLCRSWGLNSCYQACQVPLDVEHWTK